METWEFSLTFLHPVVQWDCVQLSHVAVMAVFLEGLNHFGLLTNGLRWGKPEIFAEHKGWTKKYVDIEWVPAMGCRSQLSQLHYIN